MPGLQLLLRAGVLGGSRSYADVSRCLLSFGADVYQVNGQGQKPLDICLESEVEGHIREIASSGRTSQNKKVPSFGLQSNLKSD
ncbi:hypothetical protein OS493_033257 [Desmophyllum pertusum]|uniref:Uncharacterized protein n=1 Tax=Desmophyllum pertusum TaxID=174260 RepID=A0A9X0D796_9CNID|nr:hypothetical protein OS493_033257 [Desmophyllum pertusum]